MPLHRITNIGTTNSENDLPPTVDLQIVWPLANKDMNDPISKPFSLQYNNHQEPFEEGWIQINRYFSLSGAQVDADALVGVDISTSNWEVIEP